MSSVLDLRLSTLDFLWSSANTLNPAGKNYENLKVVQAQLREKCLVLSKGGRGGVDCSSAFQESDVCRFCGTPWSEGLQRMRVGHHSYKMRRRRKKLESKDPSKLSQFEKGLLQLFSKRRDNVLVKTCSTCLKTTKVGMKKIPPKQPLAEAEVSFPLLSVEKKKPKKRKKDRFSGLVAEAVVKARTESGFLTPTSRNTSSLTFDCNEDTPVSSLNDCRSVLSIRSESSFSDIGTNDISFKNDPTLNSSFKINSENIPTSEKKKKKSLDYPINSSLRNMNFKDKNTELNEVKSLNPPLIPPCSNLPLEESMDSTSVNSLENASFKSNSTPNSSFRSSGLNISTTKKKKKKNVSSKNSSMESVNFKDKNIEINKQKSNNMSPVVFSSNNMQPRTSMNSTVVSNGGQNLKQIGQEGKISKKKKKKKKPSLVSDFLSLL